jgi:proteasome alpha subunit
LAYTRRRQGRKIFEIYDRLIFTAIGQQSDVDTIRTAALEFASREGYNRSEADVSIQRVVNAVSGPLKRAFGEFGSAPFVMRAVFSEIGETPEDDRHYLIDYDGDYVSTKHVSVLAGSLEFSNQATEKMTALENVDLAALQAIYNELIGDEPWADLEEEAVLFERSSERENRFRHLLGGEPL